MTLLAKSTIRPEDARNPVRYLGSEWDLLPSIAIQTAASEFANSVLTQTLLANSDFRKRSRLGTINLLPLGQTRCKLGCFWEARRVGQGIRQQYLDP